MDTPRSNETAAHHPAAGDGVDFASPQPDERALAARERMRALLAGTGLEHRVGQPAPPTPGRHRDDSASEEFPPPRPTGALTAEQGADLAAFLDLAFAPTRFAYEPDADLITWNRGPQIPEVRRVVGDRNRMMRGNIPPRRTPHE
nr:hypothetical protein KPHV_85580 [Kitasatospora purpeofusca]